MALFRSNAQGEIIQFFATYAAEKQFGGSVPSGAVYSLQFDESTNSGLVSAYNANSSQFRMDGGTLTQNDVAATINPDGLFYAAFRNRADMLSKINETNDPFTREEVARFAAVSFRIAGLD